MDEREYQMLSSINSGINAVEDWIKWLVLIGGSIAVILLANTIHHW